MLIQDYFHLFQVDPQEFLETHGTLARKLQAATTPPDRGAIQELATALLELRPRDEASGIRPRGTENATLKALEDPELLFVLLCFALYEQDYVPMPRDFAEKISTLPTSLGLSNIQIARALNIDSSLVSRWRNGERQIREDNPLRDALVSELSRAILQAIPRPELGALNLLEKGDPLTSAMNLWLFEVNSEPSLEELTANFLNQIQRVRLRSFGAIHQSAKETATPEALTRRIADNPYLAQKAEALQNSEHLSRQYQGTEGLRSAVLDFLLEILLAPEPQTLKLFSNQAMDWLVGDPDFSRAWLFLMQNILAQGHKIEIIHNFGRDEHELMEAVQHWLPLYLTGQITSYTLPEALDTNEQPMVRTLFIRDGHCAIHADFFRGMEDQASYHWVTHHAALRELEAQFDFLKADATQLYKMVQGSRAIETRASELNEELLRAPDPTEIMILTQATLRPGLDLPILRRFLEQGKRVTLYIPDTAGEGDAARGAADAEATQNAETMRTMEAAAPDALAPLVAGLRDHPLFAAKVMRGSGVGELCLTVHKDTGITVYHPGEAFLMEFRHPILARSFEAYLESLVRGPGPQDHA